MDGRRFLSSEDLRASCIDLVDANAGGGNEPTRYALMEEAGREGTNKISRRTARVRELASDAERRQVASTLLGFSRDESDPRVVKFAPRYTLAISLLNQDATRGNAVLEWEIDTLLQSRSLVSTPLRGTDLVISQRTCDPSSTPLLPSTPLPSKPAFSTLRPSQSTFRRPKTVPW